MPWHDRWPACALALTAMAAVVVFGVAGVAAAWKNPLYTPYLWVPCLLIGMAGGVMVSLLARLARRSREGSQHEGPS
ncbi:MAG: hypothetical protein ABIJ95_01935 [Pseudomonadota bacterium]